MAIRSLGVLTLDLVAKVGGFEEGMSKAGKSSKKWRKQVEKDAKAIGRAVKIGTAAAGAALAAMTVQSVRAAEQFNRLAAVSGTSTTEFQRYAAGAKAVGIEQDKLADIFKDMSDRVGDFIQTGGGPMADFFENIAPQIGVTAEQFRNLSGPEALGLFTSSLEKANLSQNEMTFYMEAMASDASMLLPLLRDNATGFRALGDEAERAGAIMDERTIRAANELNAAMHLSEQAAIGFRNELNSELLPVLSDFSVALSDAAIDQATAAEMGEALGNIIKGIVAPVMGAYSAIQLLGKAIGGLAFIASQVPDGLDAIRSAVGQVGDELDESAQRYGDVISDILTAGGDRQNGESRIEQIADLMEQTRAVSAQTSAEIRKVGAATAGATNPLEDYQSLIAELRTDEEKLTHQMRERLAVLDAVGEKAREQDYARVAAAATAESPEFGGLAPEVGGAFGELNKIDEAESELQDWYSTQLEMLEKFRQERSDLTATWDATEESLKKEHEDELARIEQARNVAQLAATKETLSQMAEATKAFSDEQSSAYKTLFAATKAFALAEAVINIQNALSDAAAQGATWQDKIAAMGSVTAATASIVSTIKGVTLDGQAHDGIMSVPQDGTWNLKKGERVTTAETSAKLDSMLDRVSRNGGGGPTEIRIVNDGSLPAIEGEAQVLENGQINVLLRAVDNHLRQDLGAGRGVFKQMERTYGLGRKGQI